MEIQKTYCEIADLLFCLTTQSAVSEYYSPHLDPFTVVKNPEAKSLNISFTCRDDLQVLEWQGRMDDFILWQRGENGTRLGLMGKDKNLGQMIYANLLWDQIRVVSDIANLSAFAGSVGELVFRICILQHMGLVIHASAIEWNNKGIAFSAPSGTGKTTQAKLWRNLLGAAILNGDRPAMRIIEGAPMIYGTPWSGSSPDFQNASVPLSAIIMLEQDRDNSIRELSNREAIGRLAARAFLPYWDRDLMDLALANLEKIIQSVPVYQLHCRPDQEAVELVLQRVGG